MRTISLFLMTEKGYSVLKALIQQGYSAMIESVVIGKDNHIMNDFSSEITELCIKEKITYQTRKDSFKIKSEYLIAISWRWLIHIPDKKLIVLHDSILPSYRGFAPLVNALIQGESEIGVSAIFASQNYDEGDIITQSSTTIRYPITIQEAIRLITNDYSKLVIEIFSLIDSEKVLEGKKQDHSKATFSLWRDENDYQIDWNMSSEQILRFIHAVSFPYKGASTYIQGSQKIRLTNAKLIPDVSIVNRDVGKVIFIRESFPVVVCGKGLLMITEAHDDSSGESILPLSKFRIRFAGNKA